MSEFISSTLNNGILKIILDRPKKLNSVIEPMAEEIQKALSNAKNNNKVRCILLTGKGKAFCAGQDLPEVVDKGDNYELGDTVRKSYNPIIKGIRKLEKPVKNKNIEQLQLFSKDNPVIKKLQKKDIINMTPMEAMNFLYNLKQELNDKEN